LVLAASVGVRLCLFMSFFTVAVASPQHSCP
jgi:hypothetical protein